MLVVSTASLVTTQIGQFVLFRLHEVFLWMVSLALKQTPLCERLQGKKQHLPALRRPQETRTPFRQLTTVFRPVVTLHGQGMKALKIACWAATIQASMFSMDRGVVFLNKTSGLSHMAQANWVGKHGQLKVARQAQACTALV